MQTLPICSRSTFGKSIGLGFTLAEVLVITAVIALLAMMFLFTDFRKQERNRRLVCNSNLKMIGLAMKTWALDSGDRYSMQAPLSEGGTLELSGGNDAYVHFNALSNELLYPKFLVCPADARIDLKSTNTFSSHPLTNNALISYFLGLEASDPNPQMLLSGDRHLLINGKVASHGLHTLTSNDVLSWNPKQGHRGKGNVLIVDGSVQQLDSATLNLQWRVSGVATNRLVIP